MRRLRTTLATAATAVLAAGAVAAAGPAQAAAPPAPTCQTHLVVFGQGYIATVSMENTTTDTVLEDWQFTFTMPADHVEESTFNGTLTRDGDQATLHPAVWYPPIEPGIGAMVGTLASRPAGSPLPSGFALHSEAGTTACPIV